MILYNIYDYLSNKSFSVTEAIESSIKRKKFDEFNDLPTKQQLRQRTHNQSIEESNAKLKCEIFENCKLIQEMFTNFTVGPLNTEQTQQEGKVKQQLKRKDTKHMWWNVNAEIEHVFKLQIQTDHPEKMRELSSLNGWSKLWDASYSIISSYVRKIKNTVYAIFNLFTCKPNKFTNPEEVRHWKESETVKNARLNLWNKMDNDPDSLYFIEFIL
ncbi:unnamed protein product [Rhizophagus irregularis]|nr:unnamed protein product [Rhizophagus irregularis]